MSTKSKQTELIKQFSHLTGSTEKQAKKLLKENSWNIEAAIDSFYLSHPSSQSGTNVDIKVLNKLFDRYKDKELPEFILVEGTELLCQDLHVDPSDIVMLALAFELKAKQMCEFTRQGWLLGWNNLNCDTIEAMRSKLGDLRRGLDQRDRFQQIYAFSYSFALEEGQKSLPGEVAIALWEVFFKDRQLSLVPQWLNFIETHSIKGVSKDTWNLVLEFLGTELQHYDPNGAWPILIDEFVNSCVSDESRK